MDCPNLQELFGKEYRISFDPAYMPTRKNPDPWYMVIQGRLGAIYPDGPVHLRVDIDGHAKIAGQVAALEGVTLVQDGDFEKTIRFPLAIFGEVARLIRAKRRPQRSPAQLAALQLHGEKT